MAKKQENPFKIYFSWFANGGTRPIKRSDGIQSRSKRGAFASNWWAKRWIALLESYGMGSRLERGRSYARGGQVLQIDIGVGQVQARVQGSRPKPYTVEIQVKALADKEWERVLDAISEQAIFTAQLLNGEMPQEIETVFEAARIPLFPKTARDLMTGCSCPDDANPCKHTAAVFYLLGEQFDTDPFLIFTLRGRTREQVIEGLRQRRAAAVPVETVEEISAAASVESAQPLDQFWGKDSFEWTAPDFNPPAADASVIRRLGKPPGEIGGLLENLYQAMTEHVQARVFESES